MLITSDHKEQFYKKIIESENVVIIPNTDVDSLCAASTLTGLLDADEIMYTVNAISSWSQIEAIFKDYAALAQPASSASTSSARTPTHFVLINCGGYRSLIDLEIPSSFFIFIVDSRRPFHLDNVYDQKNVSILCQYNELNALNIPSFNEIFNERYNEDATDDEEDEEDENQTIAERIERRMIKRRTAKNWRDNRDRLLYEYQKFVYMSTPSSVLLLQLAHQMNKATAALTWCAAVGLASQQVENAISSVNYSAVCFEHLRPFVRRFSPRERNKTESTFRVSFDRDLALPLYRHWTLQDSIYHDLFFIGRCRLWTQAGKDQLRHVYASLGLPLDECSNSYDKMSSERRAEVFRILDTHMGNNYYNFFSHFGYARNFSSADKARILAIMLQQCSHAALPALPTAPIATPTGGTEASFWQAFRLLKYYLNTNGGQSTEMDTAIVNYKTAITTLRTLVFDSMQQRRLISTPAFLMLTIQNGKAAEVEYLNSTHCVHIFTHLALRVFAGSAASERSAKKKVRKPLFIAILNREFDGHRWYTCSGCMSMVDVRNDPERKTFIPSLFTRIMEDSTLYLRYDHVDPNVILVREDSYTSFFGRVENELPAI